MEYYRRIIDKLLEDHLEAFGGVLIKGPKGCGKTTSAKQRAKTVIEFQDVQKRDNLFKILDTSPNILLKGSKPILFDEWQDAPKIWDLIRKDIDDNNSVGQYILTGSSTESVEVHHTGTLRISQLNMYPMSLYESGESNGTVSLMDLFDNPSGFDGCVSDLSFDELVFAICRGGWPTTLNRNTDKTKLMIAKNLYKQTYSVDISAIDKIKRDGALAEDILRSYSRNICTPATTSTIISDVKANHVVSDTTIYDYINALERLYIIDDIEAWCPSIRSKTVIRTTKKRNFIDPSLAVAALGLSPAYFDKDLKTLGFMYESLCIRDLKIYSSVYDGRMSFYRDRYGLEADGVLSLNDGRYALIEFKLGESEIEEGAKHLCIIEDLIKQYNEKEKQCPLRLPDLKVVLTANVYGYRRKDGVFVIPIGCLKD